MTVATDTRAEIDRMMYQYVQTEIDMPAFERWFAEGWPASDQGALRTLCGLFERDEMAWQDLVEAFAYLGSHSQQPISSGKRESLTPG